MIAQGRVKAAGRVVGVIASKAALAAAMRLRQPPNYFELRLDLLRDAVEEIERGLSRLDAPLIITARDPAEGGAHNLGVRERRRLLERFLDHAALVDLELRSASKMSALIEDARRRKIKLIISSHDFKDTPSAARLREQLDVVMPYRPEIFKIATRTDTVAQLDRLLAFYEENSPRIAIAAMGMGKLGPESRRRLFRLGSALTYAAIGETNAPGQPTLRQLRRTRDAYNS